MGHGMGATDLPTRLSEEEKLLHERLEALHKERVSLLSLYAALSDEQKRVADQLILTPSGL